MPSNPPNRTTLTHLPNELLLTIITHMRNLETLHTFITSSPILSTLYKVHYKKILVRILHQNYSLQFQKIITTIIDIRNRSNLTSIDCFEEYLEASLEDEEVSISVGDISDPLNLLSDIASIERDIHSARKTFISSCHRHLSSNFTCDNHAETPPSPTETHRILLALWRLQLLFSLSKSLINNIPPLNYNSEDPNVIFLTTHLTSWEFEEVECAYYHLRDQYLSHRVRGPIAQQNPRIRRFLANLGYTNDGSGGGDKGPGGRHEHHLRLGVPRAFHWEKHITYTFHCCRDWDPRPKSPTLFSDSEKSNIPNAACMAYANSISDLELERNRLPSFHEIGRGPLTYFHKWGWCMWDAERLFRCGFIREREVVEPAPVIGPAFPGLRGGGKGEGGGDLFG